MAAENLFKMMGLPHTLEASTRVPPMAMDKQPTRLCSSIGAREEHITLSSKNMKEISRMAKGTAMAKFSAAMTLYT